MNIFHSIILGIIQGLTEFLPISSSGHLAILPKIFGWQDQGLAFDVLLHLGTLLAVLIFFRKTWLKMIKSLIFYKNENYRKERKLILLMIIAIVPAVIIGILFNHSIENRLRIPLVIAINLIFWSLILWISDWYAERNKNSTKENSPAKSLIIGIFQMFSLLPGGSRSGLAITGGFLTGLKREEAVRFSFLISAPLIFGAGLVKGIDVLKNPSIAHFDWLGLCLGFLAAFLAGFLAIKLLSYLAKKNSFLPFVIYRIILGILILVFLV